MTVQFYNYLAAVEVEPQSVATPTHKFTRARYTLIGAAPLPGQAIDCPGQILQIRDCPGDSGTVGAYASHHFSIIGSECSMPPSHSACHTKFHPCVASLPGYSKRLASEKNTTHLVHSDLLEHATVRKSRCGSTRQGDVQAASSRGGWETPYILQLHFSLAG